MEQEILLIDVNLIDNPGHDARMYLDQDKFNDLCKSIHQNGILQPILVRRRGERFEVISGNRRLQAARALQLSEVPALVRDASDSETAIYRFEENLKRADISVIEEAKYIAEALTSTGLSVQEFAEQIGRSDDWIESRLSVAEMPEYLQEYLHTGQVSLGAALALAQITDEKVRKEWSYHASLNGMTVHAAENALREWQKLEAYRQEADDPDEVPPPPTEPPVAKAHCVRCGEYKPTQNLKFVRICNPYCVIDEPAE